MPKNPNHPFCANGPHECYLHFGILWSPSYQEATPPLNAATCPVSQSQLYGRYRLRKSTTRFWAENTQNTTFLIKQSIYPSHLRLQQPAETLRDLSFVSTRSPARLTLDQNRPFIWLQQSQPLVLSTEYRYWPLPAAFSLFPFFSLVWFLFDGLLSYKKWFHFLF